MLKLLRRVLLLVYNTFTLKEIVDLESSPTYNNTCCEVGNKSMPIPSTINYCVCEKPNFFAIAQGQLFHGSIYIITGLRDLQNNVKNVATVPLCEHLKSFS